MSREAHVRICEGLGVRLPRATRLFTRQPEIIRNKVNLPFRALGLHFQCEPVAEKTVGGCDTRVKVLARKSCKIEVKQLRLEANIGAVPVREMFF